jgi:hypothetical protein
MPVAVPLVEYDYLTAAERHWSLPQHMWTYHKEQFSDTPLASETPRSLSFVLHDIHSFRLAIQQLPQAKQAQIITGVQAVSSCEEM